MRKTDEINGIDLDWIWWKIYYPSWILMELNQNSISRKWIGAWCTQSWKNLYFVWKDLFLDFHLRMMFIILYVILKNVSICFGPHFDVIFFNVVWYKIFLFKIYRKSCFCLNGFRIINSIYLKSILALHFFTSFHRKNLYESKCFIFIESAVLSDLFMQSSIISIGTYKKKTISQFPSAEILTKILELLYWTTS